MPDWTPAEVEERLRKAVAVQAELSGESEEVNAEQGAVANDMGIIRGMRSAADGDNIVRQTSEAFSWLRWLEPVDADIVLARLEGAPWKLICWRFGISRPTADRRWRYGLRLIAWRLNGHASSWRVPSLRSMLGHRAT